MARRGLVLALLASLGCAPRLSATGPATAEWQALPAAPHATAKPLKSLSDAPHERPAQAPTPVPASEQEAAGEEPEEEAQEQGQEHAEHHHAGGAEGDHHPGGAEGDHHATHEPEDDPDDESEEAQLPKAEPAAPAAPPSPPAGQPAAKASMQEAAPAQRERAKVLALDDATLRKRINKDLASLGSISVGRPSAGALVNGVLLKSGPRLKVVDPSAAWATEETAEYLTRVADAVFAAHPSTVPIRIGHISSRRGGHLSPHKSHQSGRDVDIGYFYLGDTGPWYQRATAKNLDAARTWTLVRSLLKDAKTQYIFINTSVQKVLKEHAIAAGEDRDWLDQVFQYGGTGAGAIIRHVRGHDTHLHVRFYNPVAQEIGRRAERHLVAKGLVKPAAERKAVARAKQRPEMVPYRARKGDTLHSLARRFGTTVEALQKANGLRTSAIVAGRSYLVPNTKPVAASKKKAPRGKRGAGGRSQRGAK